MVFKDKSTFFYKQFYTCIQSATASNKLLSVLLENSRTIGSAQFFPAGQRWTTRSLVAK